MARPRRETLTDVNRRHDLVAAAAALFKEKGYHGTTMRDIARATNMQAGSPFYHFASKQDLLYAGVEASLQECLDEMEAVDPRGQDPLDYFRTLARIHLGRLLGSQPGVVPMVLDDWRHLEGEQLDSVLALRRRFETLWQSALVRLKSSGAIARADHMTCRLFLGALQSAAGWFNPAGVLSPSQVADAVVDFALWGSASLPEVARRARKVGAGRTARSGESGA